MSTIEFDEARSYGERAIGSSAFASCPEDYRRLVIRIMAIQAYAERSGATEMGLWLGIAPDHRARRTLARIVAEEAKHAHLLYRALEEIGVTEHEAVAIATGHGKAQKTESLEGPIAVGDAQNEWIDVVLNNALLDRAGSFMVENFSRASFAPWADACREIYVEEQWHKAFGVAELKKYLAAPHDAAKLAEKLTTWFARGLNFFGPPNVRSAAMLRKYGIKRKDNEALRSEYRAEVIGLLRELGCSHLLLPKISAAYPYRVEAQA